MSAANVTVVDKAFTPSGQLRGVVLDYIGPASYVQVAGSGELLSASQIGLKNIFYISSAPTDTVANIVHPMFTTNKPMQSVELKWIVTATGAELAAEQDVSAQRARLMVWGN